MVALSAGVQAASIEARLIRASNEDEKTDEQLTRLEPKLKKVFGKLENVPVTVLGLTYKPDTSTLRRSASLEIIQWRKLRTVALNCSKSSGLKTW